MDDNKLSIFPPIKLIFVAAIAACAIACAGSAGLAQTGAPMIAIEKMDVGKAPADFDFGRTGQSGPGQWVVTGDASAAGGHAIEQSSIDQTDYRFPLAIYKPLSAVNRHALVPSLVSIKSDTCRADRRRDPTPKHTLVVQVRAGR